MRSPLVSLLLFLFGSALLSCHQSHQRKTTIFLLETLNGQVKRVAESWNCPPVDPKSEFNYCNDNTTIFDENGDPVQTTFVGGTSKFAYSRDSSGNKVATRLDFDHSKIYIINADGHVLKYKESDFDDYTLFRYNGSGDIIERVDHWLDRDSSKWHADSESYVYDNAHHLLRSIHKKHNGTGIYEYKSFDSKNNWTKRVEHWRAVIPERRRTRPADSVFIRIDTVIRKITYY